jgi:GGDEF domain-containing protein
MTIVLHAFVALDIGSPVSGPAGIYPESAPNYETLTAMADEAMYRAKKAGRRRFAIA